MKIAIIGAGNVGGTLGKAFISVGHAVSFGVSNPNDPKHDRLRKDTGAKFGLAKETCWGAEIVLFATPWPSTKAAVESAGSLSGKIVVDCTNPINKEFSGLEIGQTISGGEMVQQWAKGAKVVKCFNQTGWENMANPKFTRGAAVMFAAGDDQEARKKIAELATQIGFEGIPVGPLHMARQLEQLAWLWIYSAVKSEFPGRDFAFSILRR
jgi:8-hydroxy-5-deazaflavin:NADPH oxidoreductase